MDNGECRGWSSICTTLTYVHTVICTYWWQQNHSHTQRLLTAKKSSQNGNNCGGQNMQRTGKHKCQSSHYCVPTVWVVWKLQVGERFPAVPPSSHYFKTPKFLTAFSLFHPPHKMLAGFEISDVSFNDTTEQISTKSFTKGEKKLPASTRIETFSSQQSFISRLLFCIVKICFHTTYIWNDNDVIFCLSQ